VIHAGWDGAYGNSVVIDHGNGLFSRYAHLSSVSVSAGQSVGAGQAIGVSGTTGNADGEHLHFEIRSGSAYGTVLNPMDYLP
jgi:murein DD-endopeptidase MepM/ murein hydrolase activator NlpD